MFQILANYFLLRSCFALCLLFLVPLPLTYSVLSPSQSLFFPYRIFNNAILNPTQDLEVQFKLTYVFFLTLFDPDHVTSPCHWRLQDIMLVLAHKVLEGGR